MAGRIRTIKPELIEDEKTAALTHEAHRLFVGMLLLADDYGNLRTAPRQLEGAVFWAQPCRAVARVLRELVDSGLLTPYTVRGQTYAHITNWEKHQRVDRPGKHRVPDIREAIANHSREDREPLATDLRPPTSDPDPLIREADASRHTAGEILQYLNAKASRRFDPRRGTSVDLIRARIKEGYSADDLRAIVDNRVREWAADESMAKYLTPETLFNKTKAAKYLEASRWNGARPAPPKLELTKRTPCSEHPDRYALPGRDLCAECVDA